MSDPVVLTEGLTKRFGETLAVDALDLVVPRGSVFGFLGPNGAGKTTTIRLLLDLLRPTAGTARVLGLDSRTASVEVRRRATYLPGDLELDPKRDGATLLGLVRDVRGPLDQTWVDSLVERFDIELGRPIGQLSTGNRQKVGLLAALAPRPELLILDEPTAGLDPLVQEQYHQVVREMVRDGCTVLLSSHSLDEVERLADEVAIIRQGRLVATETVAGLRARAVRRVEVRLGGSGSVAAIESLVGVGEVSHEGDRLRFSVHGPMDPVIKALAGYEVLDLLCAPADLEEIFLAYYHGEGGSTREATP